VRVPPPFAAPAKRRLEPPLANRLGPGWNLAQAINKGDADVKLADVRTWKEAQGKREYMKHLKGQRLTHKQAILAECYACAAGYCDGRVDCQAEECPLHPFMPYVTGGPRKIETRISPEDRARRAVRLRAMRQNAPKHPKAPRDLQAGDSLLPLKGV